MAYEIEWSNTAISKYKSIVNYLKKEFSINIAKKFVNKVENKLEMDYKKVKTETTAITRDKHRFYEQTGNIYKSLAVLSKRANQIGLEMKEELNRKISEFATTTDNLEEIFENREQIEIARFYERLPKPALISIHEFLGEQIYFRDPHADLDEEKKSS